MTLPKHNPYYNEYTEKAAVVQTEAESVHIMGCKLKELRRQFNITQKQLAAHLSVDRNTISR